MVEPLEVRWLPAIINVTTLADEVNAGDGVVSLREAITIANTNGENDTINLTLAGTYALLRSGDDETNVLGDFDLIEAARVVSIIGLIPSQSIIGANTASSLLDRVFDVKANVVVSMTGVTIQGGRTDDGLVSGSDGQSGGGILNAGVLTLTDSVISGNSTGSGANGANIANGNAQFGGDGGFGGGIFNSGTLTLTRTVVTNNATGHGGIGGSSSNGTGGYGGTGGPGGGIYNTESGTVTLANSTITGNGTGSGAVGGIDNRADGDVPIYGGSGGPGGGIFNSGTLHATGSTISLNGTGFGNTGTINIASPGGAGGGIATSNGSATLINTIVTGNVTGRGGGGNALGSSGASGGSGGGIFHGGGMLTIERSTLSGNRTGQGGFSGRVQGLGGAGGGIAMMGGTLAMTSATISGNSTGSGGSLGFGGGSGGGISLSANEASSLTANITSSTISGNTTAAQGAGGGISASLSGANSSLTVDLLHSTVANNTATAASGGGLLTASAGGTLTFNLKNSLVAGNFAGQANPDVSGTFNSQGFNLVGKNDGALTSFPAGNPNAKGDLVGGGATPLDPQIAPLANNGGPTMTHALFAASLAVDAGDPSFSPAPDLDSDQRGPPFARVLDGPDSDAIARLDIGAFELQSFTLPSSLIVDIALDENDGRYSVGDLSLREAVAIANVKAGEDTITFASSLAGQPVLLSHGQFTITESLSIHGRGASQTTINAQNNSRLFEITNTAGNVTFSGLTLTGGKFLDPNIGGGAILSRSSAQLTIREAIIANNSTTGDSGGGGAVASMGPLLVAHSTISGNFTTGASSSGGGLQGGSITIVSSTIAGNHTDGVFAHGGGISATSLAVINSTISGNFTLDTFSVGGGMSVSNAVTIISTTITGNSVTSSLAEGGGLFASSGPVTIQNSIVAGNSDLQDGSNPDLRLPAAVTIQYSLIGSVSGTTVPESNPGPDANGNKMGGRTSGLLNPQLAPLSDNRGLTQTHALCTGPAAPHASCVAASPALTAGNNALNPADTFDLDRDGNTTELLPFDQRGRNYARVFNATVEMGSFEVQPIYFWHNDLRPLDVTGGQSSTPDGVVAPGDALAVINYINAFGSGQVPLGAASGHPFGFLDTSGGTNGAGDNFIAPNDALAVIDFINAFGSGSSGPSGEGENNAAMLAGPVAAEGPAANQPISSSPHSESLSITDLIGLLSEDVATQVKRRRH